MSQSTAAIAQEHTLAELQAGDFRSKFDKLSYEFQHRLTDNPLFELPALIDLTRRLPGAKTHYDAGTAQPHYRWSEMPACPLTVEEILHQIETANAWFFIKIDDDVPDYGRVLDNLMGEAEELAGTKFRAGMKKQEMIIFVTSPKRVTTYHIDRECSFLLQVRGSKTIHIFDRNDREVLPEDEIERFWTVDNNAARYRKEYQSHATSYALRPGNGVHIPVNFPHWLENDDNVSISVNINIQLPDSKLANIYRANYFLRKMGLKPNPPQTSGFSDGWKTMAMTPLMAYKRRASARHKK